MKKFALAIFSSLSLGLSAAPPAYFSSIIDGVPFNALLTQTAAELIAIDNSGVFACPGCYGFDVEVEYRDGSRDLWFLTTALAPTGQIIVTFLPGGPDGPDGYDGPDFEYEEKK